MMDLESLLAVKLAGGGGGGGSKGITMDLLWENARPNDSFPSQTLPISKDTYKQILVVFQYAFSPVMYNTMLLPNNGRYVNDFSPPEMSSMCSREFSVTDTGINFSGAFYRDFSNITSVKNTNNMSLPLKIYGIK